MSKVIVLHNIVSPYKTLLFNNLSKRLTRKLEVLYFAETACERDWDVKYDKIEFSYKLLNKGTLDHISQIMLAYKVLKKLMEDKNEIAAVVVGEYNGLAYWIAWIWTYLYKIPFGSIMESTEHDHKRVAWREWIKKVFFSHCNFVFAAGTQHKCYAEQLGVKACNIHVIGGVGGVDRSIYKRYLEKALSKGKIQQDLGLPQKKYFIYVGRFSPEKNIIKLLQAYQHIKMNEAEWGLLLVGSGQQRKYIEEYIQKYQIQDVVFPGFIQQNYLPQYYLASEVFILPSISETWGLVVDEAIALGLPVLVSIQCGCIPDIVKDKENGLIFDPNEINSMIKAMYTIIADDQMRKNFSMESYRLSLQYTPAHSAVIMANAMRQYIL